MKCLKIFLRKLLEDIPHQDKGVKQVEEDMLTRIQGLQDRREEKGIPRMMRATSSRTIALQQPRKEATKGGVG